MKGWNLNEQAGWLLEQDSEARFLVRFSVQPDPGRRDKHIDQFAVLDADESRAAIHAVNASLAAGST